MMTREQLDAIKSDWKNGAVHVPVIGMIEEIRRLQVVEEKARKCLAAMRAVSIGRYDFITRAEWAHFDAARDALAAAMEAK